MKKLMAILLAGIMLITALPISAADFESPEIPPEGHGVWINQKNPGKVSLSLRFPLCSTTSTASSNISARL